MPILSIARLTRLEEECITRQQPWYGQRFKAFESLQVGERRQTKLRRSLAYPLALGADCRRGATCHRNTEGSAHLPLRLLEPLGEVKAERADAWS